jgi:para-aminobenzoate synthetase/4-amino-4-deoxychorismate lyase
MANEPEARFWQDGAPFVLLDDARPGGFARLLRRPSAVVETRDPAGIAACLERLRGESRHAAGFLAYEAGYALERKLAPLAVPAAGGSPPLLWFGLFETEEAFDPAALPDPRSAWAGRPRPLLARADYEAAIGRIADHIAEGDLYQANFTFQAEIASAGHPVALYSALRARAGAGWGGIVFTGAHWLLCFSPESFFTLAEGRLTARPMKGTAPLSTSPEDLRGDEKQRAENLMIVDLLRNDLARVAWPGTVAVPELFAVETYPTLRQMTSTVTATLAEGLGPVDLLETIFPCGSITGAPKIRAMEIIAGLEAGPRGVYTGAIGVLAPDGGARFNVAIRTLVLRDGESKARIGLGSGIVADSVAGEEWAECLAKGAFVESGQFDLIETMRFEPRDGIAELERHLARMKASAEALDFHFDRHHVRNELQASFALGAPRRLRLRLSRSGAIAIEARALPADPAGPVAVAVAPMPASADDFRLRHKTSDRGFYQAARVLGAFETVFLDPEGFVTEGSFTSVFVRKSGTLLTPKLGRGLLPGILRERLIEEGRAREAELRLEDLAGTFYIGNAVRGLIAAMLL